MSIDAKLIEDKIKEIQSMRPSDASLNQIASTLQYNVSEEHQKIVLNVLERIFKILKTD